MQEFNYILILLCCSVIFIVICHKMHLPAIIGYLAVGCIVGPGALGWLPSIEDMHFLAEFGIVFLMFTLGLEFSIPKLIAAKRTLIGVGSTQVIICTAVAVILLYWLLGLELSKSFIIGGALALSSTAVVVKQLIEQKEQLTLHGELSINILLFQDIAAVLFLILIPAMTGNGDDDIKITFLLTILKGLTVFISMVLAGHWVLKPLFHEVAKARSTELFMLATLFIALAAAGITHYFGLSMALGAFLAGLMLGETEFKHQIELDIRPFRDVLLGLFFVIIGAYLDLSKLPLIWQTVLAILFSMILGKILLITFIAKVFGRVSFDIALKTGLILAHGGEFGFVVLTEAIKKDILSIDERTIIFSAVALSVVVSTIIIRFNHKITKFILDRINSKSCPEKSVYLHTLTEHTAELSEHVILCGFGRVGQVLSRFLEQEKIPWIALDLDPMRVSKTSIAGEHSFYGDATRAETLLAAGLSRARMIVITFSHENEALNTIKHVRNMRLDLPIFVRTRDDINLDLFQEAGATEVVPESLEASIMLASHLLLTLGVPTARVIAQMRKIHTDRYAILQGYYKGHDEISFLEEEDSQRRSLHSIYIPDTATAIGKTLEDIQADQEKIVVKSVSRDKKKISMPDKDFIINSHDVLVVFATLEETVILEENIFKGH